MNVRHFVCRQIAEIRRGGLAVAARKFKRGLAIVLYPLAILPVLLIRLVRPLVLIRFGTLHSEILGVFAQVPEIHLCERDAYINQPSGKFVNIWYFEASICNKQLAVMWRRKFRIWPGWLVKPLMLVNRLIPGGVHHEIKKNNARDVYNLFDRFPEHLKFDASEELFGQTELRKLGVEKDGKFVCILVRDGAFKDKAARGTDWSYHDYRNTDINNYVLVAEELAKRGFYVFRMGSIAKEAFKTQHPRVIDYATNGMRSDFMDIYLGAKCEFCITMGSGWDSIPFVFRKPIVYVNMVPVGGLYTFSSRYISITKRHWSTKDNRELTLSEIFTHGVGLSYGTSDYQSKNVNLLENTSDEILDVVIEMLKRLNGTWQAHDDDRALQDRFWELFQKHAVVRFRGHDMHGELRARFGAVFLRKNQWWLD